MSEISQLIYPWKRYWVTPGSHIPTDFDGFPNPESGKSFTINQLIEVPCLILLGEPGVGKTTEILQMEAPSGHLICKYKLDSTSSESRLFDLIENQPSFIEWRRDQNKRLYLCLDGLDEGLLNIKTIVNSLVEWIDKYKFSNKAPDTTVPSNDLYFRITCRSAIRTNELAKRLEAIYKIGNVRSYELTSLTQQSIRDAARIEEINDDQFITAVKKCDAITFSTEPLTLAALFSDYRAGHLSESTFDRNRFYLKFCTRLCTETNESHSSVKKLVPAQRIAIASRMAMYSILSNRHTLWNAEVAYEEGDEGIHFNEFIGHGFDLNGVKYNISLSEAKEVLDSALFAMNLNGGLKFKHKRIAEFLAAWHLSELGISDSQFKQMLTSPFDNLKVIPQIREVASWLISMNKDAFILLQTQNPFLVLEGNRILQKKERETLINAIFNMAHQYEVTDDYRLKRFYHKLHYSGISKVIGPLISKKNYNPISRRIAIAIAGACKEVQLVKVLHELLNNVNDDYFLRKEALNALVEINHTSSYLIIRQYALANRTDDYEDELKGVALRALYPLKLSTIEAIAALSPIKRRNLFGSYRGFLFEFGNIIPNADLMTAISLIINDDERFVYMFRSEFENLIKDLFNRIWDCSMDYNLVDVIARGLYKFITSIDDSWITSDVSKRRLFLSQLLKANAEFGKDYPIIKYAATTISLARREDWDWLMTIVKDSDHEKIRSATFNLLWHLIDYDNAAQVVEILEVLFAHPDLKIHYLYYIDAWPVDSQENTLLREDYMRNLRRRTSPEKELQVASFPILEQAINLIEKFSEHNLDEWWHLIYLLRINEKDGTYNEGHDFEFDLTKLPGWSSLPQFVIDDLIRAAKIYIEKYAPKSNWIFSKKYNRTDLAVYKALLLIMRYDPLFISSLSPQKWDSLSEVIIYCSFNSLKELSSDKEELLVKCHENSKLTGTFNVVLEKYLNYQIKENRELYDLYKITSVVDVSIGEILLRLLNTSCGEKNAEHIIDLLFKCLPQLARTYCWHSLVTLTSTRLDKPVTSTLMIAASRAIFNPIEDEWRKTWRLLIKRPELIRQIMDKASSRQIMRLSSMTATQLGDLLLWLFKNSESRDSSEDGHPVLKIDHLSDLKEEIVRNLIEEGSVDSVTALIKCHRALPSNMSFKWWIVSAKENLRKNTWTPPSPSDLDSFLRNLNYRFVRSESELADLVIESLSRFQKKLKGNNPTSHFLWNVFGPNVKVVKNKDENSLSDFVKMHLDYDLVDRNIVINREVEIRRGSSRGDGERTDILIQAINGHDKLSLVIEVKGNWHRELTTGMRYQLRNKYMSKYKTSAGIYLVGWFKPSRDYKNRAALANLLERQAIELRDEGANIKSFVLDCSL